MMLFQRLIPISFSSSSSTQIRCHASKFVSGISPENAKAGKQIETFFEVKEMVYGQKVWKHRQDDRITRLLQSICVPWFLFSKQSKKSVFDRIQVDGTALQPLNPADQKSLINLAQPAPFGRGSETVFDETVRKALEITADRLVVDKKPITKILSAIEETWYNYKFDAKLYKMHIYQESGKFLPHRDTVHDPSHIATLVVSLKDPEEGGELVVRHNGESHAWSPPGWCAFFTDCEHEVKEVKKGCRIVLQYDLYAKIKPIDKKNEKDEGCYERTVLSDFIPMALDANNIVFPGVVKNRIKEELRSFWNPSSKEEFGLLLGHSYVTLSADHLKGADLVLYQIVQEMEEIESELVHVYIDTLDGEVEKLSISPILERKDEKPIIILSSLQYEEFGRFEHQDGSEYCGNEAMPEHNNYHAAVLIMKKNSINL